MSLLSSERGRAVRLSLEKGRLEVSASSPEFGEARESIEVDFAGEGAEIGFNAQYIVDFLSVVGTAEVALELKDSESQGLLRPVGEEAATTATSSCPCGSEVGVGLGGATRDPRPSEHPRSGGRAAPRPQRLPRPQRAGQDVAPRGGGRRGPRPIVPHRGRAEHDPPRRRGPPRARERRARPARSTLEVELRPGRRVFRVDGRDVAPREYGGRLEVVVYSTDRLRVVRGSMRDRRQYLDRQAAALWPSYRADHRAFERVLAQRNAALEARGCRPRRAGPSGSSRPARRLRRRRAAYAERLNAALGTGSVLRGETYRVTLSPSPATSRRGGAHARSPRRSRRSPRGSAAPGAASPARTATR